MQQYTAYVPNVDPSTTEDDVREWVSTVVNAEAERGKIDVYGLVVAVNKAQAASPKPAFVHVNAKRTNEELLADVFKVHEVTIVPNLGALPASAIKLGMLKIQLAALEGKIKGAAVRAAELAEAKGVGAAISRMMSPSPASLNKALVAMRLTNLTLADELDRLVVEQSQQEDAFRASGAFVTFEHRVASENFITMFPHGMLGRLLMPKHKQIKGRTVHVLQAPAPSYIKYFNLPFTAQQRSTRTCFSNCTAGIIILISFGLILVISTVDQGFQRLINPTDCSARTLSTFVRIFNTKKTAADENAFLASYPNSNALMFCVCQSKPWGKALATTISADAYTRHCTYQTCSRMTKLGMPEALSWPECILLATYAQQASIFHTIGSVISASQNPPLSTLYPHARAPAKYSPPHDHARPFLADAQSP